MVKGRTLNSLLLLYGPSSTEGICKEQVTRVIPLIRSFQMLWLHMVIFFEHAQVNLQNPYPFTTKSKMVTSSTSSLQCQFRWGCLKEAGEASIGVMIRVDLGLVIASMSDKVSLPTTVDKIEALAVIRTPLFAQDVRITFIILRGDSERVINSLKSVDACFLLMVVWLKKGSL